MATLAREVLTALGMDCRISCIGQSMIGIRVSGTWAGTISFGASQAELGTSGPGGGSAFKAASVFSWPSALSPTLKGGSAVPVVSITANGNYYWPVQNYATFVAQLTAFTSGAPVVTLAAAMDSSWGDAFLTSANKFRNSFANGSQNVLSIPLDANLGRRLRSLVVTAVPHTGGGGSGTGSSSIAGPTSATWASNPVLRIYDGDQFTGSLLFGYDLPTLLPVERTIPIPLTQTTQYGVTDGGIYFTPGSVATIVLASGGSNVSTNINAELATA